MRFNVFYPFTNNSPANQARGVIDILRRAYPEAEILSWDFLGKMRREGMEPPRNAELNLFFDMSYELFQRGAGFARSLDGPILVGSVSAYRGHYGGLKAEDVDFQLIVGRTDPQRSWELQVGYFMPTDELRPAKPKVPLALIDHWRQGHPEDHHGSLESSPRHTRANYELLRRALTDLSIPFVELGHHNQGYRRDQIFDLYRRCHFYFLTFFECFGLPLLEHAAAGTWILAPSERWLGEPDLARIPTFFSWRWDRGRLEEFLTRRKEEILDDSSVPERWRHDNLQWYHREFRHQDRLLEAVDRCLEPGYVPRRERRP